MRRKELVTSWILRDAPAGAPALPYGAIRSPSDLMGYLTPLAGEAQEDMWVVFLDARMRVFGHRLVSRGVATTCIADTTQIARAAVLSGAAAVILAHCHPSGDTTPSQEDVTVTPRLVAACAAVGVPMLDHVVVGLSPDGAVAHTSMRAMGVL